MKNFLTALCLSVFALSGYGATDCAPIISGGNGGEWLDRFGGGNEYYHCGEHSGDDDGCPDQADVYANGPSGWGIYTCYVNGPRWAYNAPNRWIADCSRDPATELDDHIKSFCDGTDYVYFADYVSGPSFNLENICKISQTDVARYMINCESTGGQPSVCHTRCWCANGYGLRYKTDYECECIDADAYLDQINATKLCVKGNFYACETDADCLGGRTPVKPSHSTAWRCVNQKYDVKVCAATACENGWHVKQGYGFCEQDASTQTTVPNTVPVKNNVVAGGGEVMTKICPDANMDADCRCTRVAETVERGGVCVCADSNKEIKDGKCEYTAAYRSKLKTDIDSKYSKIKSLTASFEVNKWKDAEGNFNTARLASDSIAGVVLGTAGGIITSKLVKKNQLKKGFEDIRCHIGGQSVADYGDEFTVGR